MPKLDGISLLKKIRHIRPDAKLMLMSAFDEKEYLHEAIAVGAFPHTLSCEAITNISFEKQSVEFEDMRFVKSSPVTRETIRVLPEEEHTVSLFMDENKFQGDVVIEDISLNAAFI